jgi:hypothetical protein
MHTAQLQLHISIYQTKYYYKTYFPLILYLYLSLWRYALVQVHLGSLFELHNPETWTEGSDVSSRRELLNRANMPPRAPLTSSFSVSDTNNEVVCPLTNQDGSNCRKRCLGVSICLSSFTLQTSGQRLRRGLNTADTCLQYPGKALSFDAGAHSPSTSRLLHSKASSDRGKFPIDGQHPSFSPTTTSSHNGTN